MHSIKWLDHYEKHIGSVEAKVNDVFEASEMNQPNQPEIIGEVKLFYKKQCLFIHIFFFKQTLRKIF
jgi:hypothetical protein